MSCLSVNINVLNDRLSVGVAPKYSDLAVSVTPLNHDLQVQIGIVCTPAIEGYQYFACVDGKFMTYDNKYLLVYKKRNNDIVDE